MLHGARGPEHVRRLLTALDLFQRVPIPEDIWDDVGQNLAKLRAAGVSVPLADVIIATAAIRAGIAVWTRDSHFTRMASVLSELTLFVHTA